MTRARSATRDSTACSSRRSFGEFLIAARHLLGERRQRSARVGARVLQARHFVGRVALESLQLRALLLDFRDQLCRRADLSVDGVDFAAAFPGEISIVGERAAETGRVALVQQQLELFLPADHVRGRTWAARAVRSACSAF